MPSRLSPITPLRLLAGIGLAVTAAACSFAGDDASVPARPAMGESVAAEPANAASFAVVELFTSQGCSSCPPADAVLGAVLDEARRDGTRVYPIAFHVDYWDRLGWRDPFGRPEASARQNAYVRAMRLDSAYTPQMVVNGRVEFVGSDARRARAEIRSALGRPAITEISLKVDRKTRTELEVEFEVKSAPVGAALHVAAVERGLTISVARGENGGRTLKHDNVARAFVTADVPRSGKGRTSLLLPPGADPEKVSVIAFVQDPGSMEILGAAGMDLNAPASAVRPGLK